MTGDELDRQPGTKHLRQVILDLSLISHVRGVSYDSSGGGGSVSDSSGAVPPGAPDRKGDREEPYRQKSHLHFLSRYAGLRRRVDSMSDPRAESLRDEILSDARAALRDWRKTPSVPGQDPSRDTYHWKIKVANDDRPSRVVAGHYGVSHVTILRWRKLYRGLTP